MEISTGPSWNPDQNAEIWARDRRASAIELSGTILLTRLIRRGGSAYSVD